MEPLYSETYLEAMMPKERRQKRNLMIAICIILPIVDLLVLHSALLLFFVVVIDAVMIVLLPKKQTAYEYVFVDGQIDNDAIYGLESFDHKINDLHDSIEKTENEKLGALKEFEETVKPDILEEIQGRYVDKLELMNRELTKKKDEYTKLDDLVKQQRIYISSN